MPTDRERLPSAIARSPSKAQRTYTKTLESAEREYEGDEERAHRVVYSALKHSYDKVGDHWEPKPERGPSDAQAAQGSAAARSGPRDTAGGVNATATKAHLLEVARRLAIPGRSRMRKEELVRAIERANDRSSAAARRRAG